MMKLVVQPATSSVTATPLTRRHMLRRVVRLFLCVAIAVFVIETAAEENAQISQRRVVTNKFGMEFIEVPPGEFIMGSKLGKPWEKPHRVRITKPFFMGVTEVTVRQRHSVMEAADAGWQSYDEMMRKSNLARKSEGRPTIDFEWATSFTSESDAVKFVETLSKVDPDYDYRLPTEAEWEYACRGKTVIEPVERRDCEVSQPREDGNTCQVKTQDPNAFGLYDMLLNVGEFCSDWIDDDYYAHSPVDDPQGPEKGTARVLRGMRSQGRERSYAAWRRDAISGDGQLLIGVRLVLIPEIQAEEIDRPVVSHNAGKQKAVNADCIEKPQEHAEP